MRPLFRPEAVRDARYRLDGALILAQPLSARLAAAAIAVLLVIAAWYLSSFDYRRSETVTGFVTTTAGVVTLAATRGGTLLRRHVQVGDVVSAGDPLFECSTDTDSAFGRTVANQLITSEQRLAELDKQTRFARRSYSSRKSELALRNSALEKRLSLFNRQLRSKEKLSASAANQLARLEPLRDKQFVTEHDIARQTELVLTRRAEVVATELQVADARKEMRQLDLARRRLPDEHAKELSELSMRRNTLLATMIEQRARLSYVVRAPVEGRISAIQGSKGQQLSPVEPVVTLIPAGSKMIVNLLAPSRTVGFLSTNDSVELHVDAFPYQKFGSLKGRVSDISRAAFKPGDLRAPIHYRDSVYKVVVALERNYMLAYGVKHPLQVDMTLTGSIAIDRRSLMQWLLEPLLSARS
ncbi:MAG: HlyD family secretion protein [Gammaproteobacteria bacterium]|nr:HlyD family secretion protein [Gammaproteobacteria bacterium]